jgi:hypothetical protein
MSDKTRTIVYAGRLEGHGALSSLTTSRVAAFHSYAHKTWFLGRFAVNKHYYIEIREDPNCRTNQDILAYRFNEASGTNQYFNIKPAAQIRFEGNKTRVRLVLPFLFSYSRTFLAGNLHL